MQVRDRNQPHLLSAHGKGKLQLGEKKGEKQNLVLEHRLLSGTPVSFPGQMDSRRSTEACNFEKTKLVEKKKEIPIEFQIKLD